MNRKTHMIFAIAAAALISTVALSPSANAQSFNCNYARTPDEVAICNSDRLSNLDQQMSRQYFALRNSLDRRSRVNLEREQAEWLASRRRCGNAPGCIARSITERMEYLADWGLD